MHLTRRWIIEWMAGEYLFSWFDATKKVLIRVSLHMYQHMNKRTYVVHLSNTTDSTLMGPHDNSRQFTVPAFQHNKTQLLIYSLDTTQSVPTRILGCARIAGRQNRPMADRRTATPSIEIFQYWSSRHSFFVSFASSKRYHRSGSTVRPSCPYRHHRRGCQWRIV